MKNYEIKEIPAKAERVCVSRTCDICGVKATHNYGDDWGAETSDKDEIQIIVRHQVGTSYPEGSSGEEFHPDICPKCFKEKVVPALRALGITTDYVEYDW